MEFEPKNYNSGKNPQNRWKGLNYPYLGWGNSSKKGGDQIKFFKKWGDILTGEIVL